jgi:hypothetical protein
MNPGSLFRRKTIKLLLQVVGPEILRVLPVPLCASFPVPFLPAMGVPARPLTLTESWVRDEPATTNPARTFSHRFLSPLVDLRKNDGMLTSDEDRKKGELRWVQKPLGKITSTTMRWVRFSPVGGSILYRW